MSAFCNLCHRDADTGEYFCARLGGWVEKCPFTRMSCKHGEPCDYECGTVKWRKALQDEGGAK